MHQLGDGYRRGTDLTLLLGASAQGVVQVFVFRLQ